ncbi:MAG: hypothetical protein ABW252_18010 [Polyangiales bacterium]
MADDSDSFTPGFLDTLVPDLRKKAERFRALPVHPRMVHATVRPGQRSLVAASFAPAVGPRPLHAALKPLVEAALLAELSRPSDQLAEDESRLSGLELVSFATHPFDLGPALSPFALLPAPLDDATTVSALALLRRELQFVDDAVPDEPVARYSASFLRSQHPFAPELARALRTDAPGGAWGERPGVLARAAADRLASFGHAGVEPTRAGIEALEAVVVHPTPGVIRWMEPLLFQALCDLVAVTAVSAGLSVEWGVSEPDPDSGLAPPPLIRVTRKGESFHVPLGEHVLRWCVMPMGRGETIPSLGAWAEHEFS